MNVRIFFRGSKEWRLGKVKGQMGRFWVKGKLPILFFLKN
jgi:hypothetical protein